MPATGVPADALARRVTFRLCNNSKQETVESSNLCTSDASYLQTVATAGLAITLDLCQVCQDPIGFKSRTCGMYGNMLTPAKSHINQPDISSKGSLLSRVLALTVAKNEDLCCSVPAASFVVFVVFVVSLFPEKHM